MNEDKGESRWIAHLAIFVGALVLLLGLMLNGLYGLEVLQSRSSADGSMVFWALPLALIGCLLVLAGAVLIWLARRAARGDRALLSLVRALLIVLAAVAGLFMAGILLQTL